MVNSTINLGATKSDIGHTHPAVEISSGQVPVNRGGTGRSSLNSNRLLAGGTSTTANVVSISSGSSGQVLTSNGSNSAPSWSTAPWPRNIEVRRNVRLHRDWTTVYTGASFRASAIVLIRPTFTGGFAGIISATRTTSGNNNTISESQGLIRDSSPVGNINRRWVSARDATCGNNTILQVRASNDGAVGDYIITVINAN
ncbi:MAG: hypothetical protein FWE22_00775 [Firmicutes bacterium]|nr:hypothetical protein [Bacillota bacterium]